MIEYPEKISGSEEIQPKETAAGLELRGLLEEDQLMLDVLQKRKPFDNTLDPYSHKPGRKETATKILEEYADSLIKLNSFIEEQLDPDKAGGDVGDKYRSIAARLQSLGEGIDTTSSVRTRTLLVIDYAKQLDKRLAIYSNRLNPSPSDIRHGAKHYELVIAMNPKTGKSGRFLYWWDGKEIKIEQVDVTGEHTPDTQIRAIPTKTKKEARRFISEDVKDQSEALEIIRNARLAEVTTPQLIKELDQKRGSVDDEWASLKRMKESIKGKRYRRSVSGPSLERRLEKYRDELLPKALDEYEAGLNRMNDSLNERVSMKRVDDEMAVFDRYKQLGEELVKLSREKAGEATSIEERYRLLKRYDKILKKRLEAFDKLAEERGLDSLGKRKEKENLEKLKEKPSEKKEALVTDRTNGKPRGKKSELGFVGEPSVSKDEVTREGGKPDPRARPMEQVLPPKIEPSPKTSYVEPETQPTQPKEKGKPKEKIPAAIEVSDIEEALSTTAKELKGKGGLSLEFKSDNAGVLVKKVIFQSKEMWEKWGINIDNISVNAEIKPENCRIDADINGSWLGFPKRIETTLTIQSEDGVLKAVEIRSKPEKIGIPLIISVRPADFLERQIGGEKIHSQIFEWFASEMEERGARVDSIDFAFTSNDTLRVGISGRAK